MYKKVILRILINKYSGIFSELLKFRLLETTTRVENGLFLILILLIYIRRLLGGLS